MDVILKNVADIRHIGSIFSSSSFLSDRILEYADIENKSSIVEIGPGSGAFTKHILPTLHPTQTFFAIEKDMHLQQQLMKTLPDLQVYNGCASDIEIYMRDIGISSVDCIISSLPRALFENTLQNKLLSSLYDALEEGGTFVTFAYLHSRRLPHAVAFTHKIREYFPDVIETNTVRLNIPPAFVYVCKK